ncbi:MAG: ATP-binding protein [Deltaproteobacteria bacterium]
MAFFLLVVAMAVVVRFTIFPQFAAGAGAVRSATTLLILISAAVIGVGWLLIAMFLKRPPFPLPESDQTFRFLFDSWPSPAFLVRADDAGILDTNARAADEYKYERDELLQMSFADLELDRLEEKTLAALKNASPSQITELPMLHHERKDGSVFTVNYLAHMSTHHGEPVIVLAMRDLASSLEKEMRFIQTGKMVTLGEMATGIAHELNQPLNAIRLGCDYLAKNLKRGRVLTSDQISTVHNELVSNIDRASRTVNYVRRFGRKPEETMYPMDINEPIRNIFSLLRTQLKARGVRWKLDLAENLPLIEGDVNRLEQVFINLVINARDAMSKPKEVDDTSTESNIKVLSMEPFLERVVVTVSDTGPGIPEPLRTKIFEPFFTTKEAGEGTGLGLSIVSCIVEEHQGTIEVARNDTPGATFRLTFPPAKTVA